MEEHEAEMLLAELSANDVVQSHITAGGDVTYAPSTRVRVEADERGERETDDARIEAEAEPDEGEVRARARVQRDD
jgi:hypothetical protein